ncbi:hypothetical protein T06_15694, partial [Trichinella sp. T6]
MPLVTSANLLLVTAGCSTKREVRPELSLGGVIPKMARWPSSSKTGLQQTLWRGTASSGQNVPPVSGDFVPGDAPGTFVTPLPPLSGRVPPSHGGAFVILARPITRGRSGRSASHLHGGRTGTSVDAAAFSGGPSRARAH